MCLGSMLVNHIPAQISCCYKQGHSWSQMLALYTSSSNTCVMEEEIIRREMALMLQLVSLSLGQREMSYWLDNSPCGRNFVLFTAKSPGLWTQQVYSIYLLNGWSYSLQQFATTLRKKHKLLSMLWIFWFLPTSPNPNQDTPIFIQLLWL